MAIHSPPKMNRLVVSYIAQLPQTFNHGLPPSSLEPRTINQLYPPTKLFPEPPLEGENAGVGTPLQTATAIVHATENIKQLTIDFKQAVWTQSGAKRAMAPTIAATAPVVPLKMRKGVNWTPPTLPNRGYKDVDGYIP